MAKIDIEKLKTFLVHEIQTCRKGEKESAERKEYYEADMFKDSAECYELLLDAINGDNDIYDEIKCDEEEEDETD